MGNDATTKGATVDEGVAEGAAAWGAAGRTEDVGATTEGAATDAVQR